MLGLRRDIPEIVSSYVRAHVVPKMERLRNAVVSRDHRAATEVWAELEKILDPALPYRAATYDASTWLLDQPTMAGAREIVGRTLPRPRVEGVDPPSMDIEDTLRVRGLPDELRLRVRAAAWNVREGLLALCAHAAWPLEDLVEVLGLTRTYVEQSCRRLEQENQLARRTGADGVIRFVLSAAAP